MPMTPTMHLRFVLRDISLQERAPTSLPVAMRTLQQFHEAADGPDTHETAVYKQSGWWLDVPLVEGER